MAPRARSFRLPGRYLKWLAALISLPTLYHFSHFPAREVGHREEAERLLGDMDEAVRGIGQSDEAFGSSAAGFEHELEAQQKIWHSSAQALEAQHFSRLAAPPAMLPPLQLVDTPSQLISDRAHRGKEYLRQRASAMSKTSHRSREAVKDFVRHERERLADEELKARSLEDQPHILMGAELQMAMDRQTAKEIRQQQRQSAHRGRLHPHGRHHRPGQPGADGTEAKDFRSPFSRLIEEELLVRARLHGKLPPEDLRDPEMREVLLQSMDDSMDEIAGDPQPGAPPSEWQRSRDREADEEAADKEEEEALSLLAGGVVQGEENTSGHEGGINNVPMAEAAHLAKDDMTAWLLGHRPGGSPLAGEGGETDEAPDKEQRVEQLVREREQGPAHSAASAESHLIQTPVKASVVHRCQGAPSPWMPGPFRFRQTITAFEHRKDRRQASERARVKAIHASQAPPAGVTFYAVPKDIEKDKRQQQWVDSMNDRIHKQQLEQLQAPFMARHSGKAVVVDGKMIHMPDDKYSRYERKRKRGDTGLPRRRRLLAARRPEETRLAQAVSFCGAKAGRHNQWQSCLVRHAKYRCAAGEAKPRELAYTAELAGCLRDPNSCRSTQAHLQHLSSHLRSVAFLALSSPGCLLYHKGLDRSLCGELGANMETSGYMGRCGKPGGGSSVGCSTSVRDVPGELADAKLRWETCAVVGHAPELLKHRNGASIDRHDAVFRVNPILDPLSRPDPLTVGHKTTVAVLGKAATDSILQGDGLPRKVVKHAEYVVFWHSYAAQYLQSIQDGYPNSTMSLMSPALVNWQLGIYQQLRADLMRLGLGPLPCYRFMSSGVHALLMASQMCRTINLFGFSVAGAPQRRGRASKGLRTFDLETEATILRLLWMAGAVDVCTAPQ